MPVDERLRLPRVVGVALRHRRQHHDCRRQHPPWARDSHLSVASHPQDRTPHLRHYLSRQQLQRRPLLQALHLQRPRHRQRDSPAASHLRESQDGRLKQFRNKIYHLPKNFFCNFCGTLKCIQDCLFCLLLCHTESTAITEVKLVLGCLLYCFYGVRGWGTWSGVSGLGSEWRSLRR